MKTFFLKFEIFNENHPPTRERPERFDFFYVFLKYFEIRIINQIVTGHNFELLITV